MDQQVLNFLDSQRVSVLGVLQNENVIHSSTLHFAYSTSPLSFFFITGKDTRKCESLKMTPQNASLVVGFSEEEFSTFQSEGKAEIVSGDNLETAWKTYLEKFSDRAKQKDNPEMVIIRFTPTWWRYTNLKTDPKTLISSEDN